MSTAPACPHDWERATKDGVPELEFVKAWGIEFEVYGCKLCPAHQYRPSERWVGLATRARELSWGYELPAFEGILKQLMVEAGISPMEAIMAGTSRAADNLGKASELGSFEPGKLADIIAVSGDPLKDIKDTKEIRLVIKEGKVLVNRIDT